MVAKNPVKFLKQVETELKKVVWPTKKEAGKMTAIVISVSLVVGSFIGFLDFAFTKVMQVIIK